MSVSAYDLHSHSTASDGTLDPADLVARAHAAGIHTFALTDHDTTAGLAEAKAQADRSGLAFVTGVEVSVTWEGRTVHLVGLQVEPGNEVLETGLARLRAFRDWRNEEIGRRLERQGIPDALEGARRFARGSVVGRMHFARHLVDRGLLRDVREVFRQFLARGKPGHVPGAWASLEEAVEVVSGSHSRDDTLRVAGATRAAGMLASAGSDYHGPENPWFELGRLPALPQGCVPVWQSWTR